MEVTVLRGLSYNVVNPKTIDTYVRFEVPVPNIENPSKDKTNTVKDTNSPEYNETFHVNISRQSRTLLRIFKAKVIKFEVWAKGYLKLIFFLMNFYYFFFKVGSCAVTF
jgi:coiled-coil and C2 domain-containing protein 1